VNGNEVSVPLWRQVQLALQSDIEAGLLSPGDKLPSETILATRFSANRHTIRRAIQSLEDKGILRAEQGRGTFVQAQLIAHPLARRSRLSTTSRNVGRATRREVIDARKVKAGYTVARGLNVTANTVVLQVETLRFIDDVPMVVTSHFYPLPRFDGIDEKIRESGSVTSALAQYGVDELTHVLGRISARVPAQKDAKLLQQPVSRPVLCTLNSSVDANNRYVQFTDTRFAASLIELTMFYELESNSR
jgi:GntR family transcriptional regulator, phosphonate transport system regulatory protein